MTGAAVEDAIVLAVRRAREEGVQPLGVALTVEDSVSLATQVLPDGAREKVGTGLRVDVDGALIAVFASREVEAGRVQVFTLRMTGDCA